MTHVDQLFSKLALGREGRTRLGNHVFGFVNGRKVLDLFRHLAIDYLAVGRFQETIFVGPGIRCQAVDQSNIGTFRRLDRTDAAVMRWMHVAHFEARSFAGQPARTQG